MLAAEGLIEARAGSGSYVRSLPVACPLEHDRSGISPGSPFGLAGPPPGTPPAGAAAADAVDQASRGLSGCPGNISPTGPAAPAHIAQRLSLPGDDQLVTRTRYLMSADGVPVQLATSYEPGPR